MELYKVLFKYAIHEILTCSECVIYAKNEDDAINKLFEYAEKKKIKDYLIKDEMSVIKFPHKPEIVFMLDGKRTKI